MIYMNATNRRMGIYRILQEQKSAEVNDLAKKFHVSTMTIRRDFLLFEKQGLVTTNYGGAYLNKGSSIEPSFSLKTNQMLDKKQMIGYEASKLVKDDDTIIIDCGTTTLQLVKYIQDKKLTVITNSCPIINYFSGNSKIKLILAPGEYNEISAGTFGSDTIDYISKFHADKVFISTQGCSIKHGTTVPGILDADVKRALFNAAEKKYLMVDHTKFEQMLLVKFADVSEFDSIITDDGIDEEYYSELNSICKNIIISKENAEANRNDN